MFHLFPTTSCSARPRVRSQAKAMLSIASVAIVIVTMLTTTKARPVTHPAPAAPRAAAKSNGKQLTDSMRKAAASIGKATKSADPKQVSPKIKKQQPFFAAMRKTNADIKLLSKAITARDSKDMQRCMGRTGKGISELNSTYKLSGINNAQVADGKLTVDVTEIVKASVEDIEGRAGSIKRTKQIVAFALGNLFRGFPKARIAVTIEGLPKQDDLKGVKLPANTKSPFTANSPLLKSLQAELKPTRDCPR